jgi:hypothetical protein
VKRVVGARVEILERGQRGLGAGGVY